MNKIALVLIAIVLVSSAALSQGTMAKSGQWGIQTSLGVASSPPSAPQGFPSNTSVGMKFWASDNMAVRVSVGFASVSPPSVAGQTSNSASSYSFGAGFEYHMDSKGGNVSPYVGLAAGYGGISTSGATNLPSLIEVTGFVGGEYFFSSNFSWAGQVGLGFVSESNSGGTTSSGSAFGTSSATMIASWYLN